jgi:hypothetical protein
MGRRTTALEKAETRARSLARHALTRKLERRERWLERAGVTKELLKAAMDTLAENLTATRIVERGPRAGEEVPDYAARNKAAAEIADFVRLTVGLTKNPTEVKTSEVKETVVFTTPAWLEALTPKHTGAASKAIEPPEDVVDAEPIDDDDVDDGGEA